MTPEKARALRDELQHRCRPRPDLQAHAGSRKQRELHFDNSRPEQVEQVRRLLTGLDDLHIQAGSNAYALSIQYDLTQYTFEGLEKALISQGFLLQNTLYRKVQRSIIYFSEETQLRNMRMPERLLKKSNEVYVKAWEHHPHGDHDDTPTELREEK